MSASWPFVFKSEVVLSQCGSFCLVEEKAESSPSAKADGRKVGRLSVTSGWPLDNIWSKKYRKLAIRSSGIIKAILKNMRALTLVKLEEAFH
jgi:hypothetical protein